MKEAGFRDEDVAVRAAVAVTTVQHIRLGYTKEPRRIVLEALKRVVPKFEEFLADQAVA